MITRKIYENYETFCRNFRENKADVGLTVRFSQKMIKYICVSTLSRAPPTPPHPPNSGGSFRLTLYVESAKPAQRSSHTGPPGYIGWTVFGHGSSLCRLAGLYGYSAKRD